jgi:excisionase family DNA binding protein
MLTTKEAAERLHSSEVTVRKLIETGELAGEWRARGKRLVRAVDAASVERFLERQGPFEGTRRRRKREEGTAPDERSRLQAERDDLRARNVALSDALARTRAAADAQERADAERAAVVRHLLAAADAAERADEQRRTAAAELQEAAATFTRPGHLGQLRQGEAG